MAVKRPRLMSFAVIAALSGQSARATQEHVIDLVAALPASEDGGVPVGRQKNPFPAVHVASDASTHEQPPLVSLTVDVPRLDRKSYAVGDAFTFEAAFVNSASTPMRFPVLSNASRIDRDMPDARAAVIALRFDDELLGTQLVGTHILYGAASVAGSLIVVQPGERVRVRAPGQWFLAAGTGAKEKLPAQWQRDIHLRTEIKLNAGKESLQASSTSAVDVRLQH